MLKQLGYRHDDRLLIINADDFGMCHAANLAIQQLLIEGTVSSATIMMPCGWSREAALWSAAHPHLDVGIHLTLTSEWEPYKWGPVTRDGNISSLVTKEGHFPQDVLTFEQQADPKHVKLELINQIEMALASGLEPTHLDNHMGSLYGLATGKHFLDIVFELCVRYRLPFRLPRRIPLDMKGSPALEAVLQQVSAQADALGIIILDDLVGLPFRAEPDESYDSYKQQMIALLRNLKPGISELILHPALANDELKAIHPHHAKREWEFFIFRDPDIQQLLADEGIQQIGWRDLCELQRSI